MATIDLKRFCDPDSFRSYCQRPFSKGDYTFAVEGRIIVRVPRQADAAEIDDSAPISTLIGVLTIPTDAQFEPLQIPPFPARKSKSETCIECGGLGKVHDCPDCDCECEGCDGDGRVIVTPDVSVSIRGTPFNVKYVELLSGLPSLEIERSARGSDPVRFRFDGGVGAIAPRSVPCADHLGDIEKLPAGGASS